MTDYEHGIWAALEVVRDRARRVGNAVDAKALEVEIRQRLLHEQVMFKRDPARSRGV